MAAQPPAQPVGGAAAGSNPSSSASKAPDLSIMMPRDPPRKKKKKASAVKTAPAAARQRPSKLGKLIKKKNARQRPSKLGELIKKKKARAAGNNRNDAGWEAQLARLAAYKAEHGDCKVLRGGRAEDSRLGNWVSNQRRGKRTDLSRLPPFPP